MKRATISYGKTAGREAVTARDKELQDAIFNRMFKVVQMCWWYALYAPEYGDWEEDKTKKFTRQMDSVNEVLEGHESDYRKAEKARFVEETGIDYKVLAAKIPYSTRTWMYKDKEPKGLSNPLAFPFQLNQGTQEGIFLATYTMYHLCKMEVSEIMKHYENFLEVTKLFVGKKKEINKGLQEKHIVEYFEKIEGIKVYE